MLRVRPMTETDIDAVARIRVRGWQTAYAGIVPQTYLDAMSAEQDAARRREFFARTKSAGRVENLVAVEDGEDGAAVEDGVVVGWAAHGPYRGEAAGPRDGELYALYVRPDRIGRGVGRALTGAVLGSAATRGVVRLRLWVLARNAPARRFYGRAGFTEDGATQQEDYDGTPLTEVRCSRATPAGRG